MVLLRRVKTHSHENSRKKSNQQEEEKSLLEGIRKTGYENKKWEKCSRLCSKKRQIKYEPW